MKIIHVRMEGPPKVEQLELWPPKPSYIAKVQCGRCSGRGRYTVIVSRQYQWTTCRKCEGKGYLEEEVDSSVYTKYLVSNLPKGMLEKATEHLSP